MIITQHSDNIKISGYRGKWHVIDSRAHSEYGTIFLLEHEIRGEDVPALIVNVHGQVILEDVYNGFGDLEDL